MVETNGIRLLVCLGNPGEKYIFTRHNAGWQAAEKILSMAVSWSISSWQPANGKLFSLMSKGGKELMLLMPMTFMNNSGIAVEEVTAHSGISPLEVLVICDCIDLPVGNLRLRRKGTSGGHHGIDSIIEHLQTTDFSRLRIGVGRPEPGTDVVDHVLFDWVSAEPSLENQVLEISAQCALKYVDCGYDSACRLAGECSADKINAKLKGETEIGKV